MVDINNFSLHRVWRHGTKHILWERSLFAYWNNGKYPATLFLSLIISDHEGTPREGVPFGFPTASGKALMISSGLGEDITDFHLHS